MADQLPAQSERPCIVRCFDPCCGSEEYADPPHYSVPAPGWGHTTEADRARRRYACPIHLDDLRAELGLSGRQPVDG